jgi:hypothetical protein
VSIIKCANIRFRLEIFRTLRRDGFPSGSISGAPAKSIQIDSGNADGKDDNLTSPTILTRSIDTLDVLFSVHPKAESTFLDVISEANMDNGIKGPEFHSKKERLLILLHLLEKYPNLNRQQTVSLRDAVLNNRDNQKAMKLLKSWAKGKISWKSVFWRGEKVVLPNEEAMWRDANEYATSLSDSSFLAYVQTFPSDNFFHDAAVDCEKAAYTCLRTLLGSLVSKISDKIFSIQEEERNTRVSHEVKDDEEKELKASRIEFFRKIEELSRERSKS